MTPTIENYQFKYFARNKWVYVPTLKCDRRAEQILRFVKRNVAFPEYFYHFSSGGHVAALHDHLKNEFFFKIDIQNFFYSIARNRVHRALAAIGMSGAPTYAKWSTVKTPYASGPSYVLPIGFRQSPHLASLVLAKSPVCDVLDRVREKGITISVYLDDIVGSHSDENNLRQSYQEICDACAAANFTPNVTKLAEPNTAIVAFNCDLSKGSASVTNERIRQFYSVKRSEISRNAFEAYRARVGLMNTA